MKARLRRVDGYPNTGRSEALRHNVTKKILLIGGICLALAVGAVVCLFVAVFVSMERGEKHQRQIREEQRSGKWDFGDQPALFAVAQAIVKDDQDAIRAAAKALQIARQLHKRLFKFTLTSRKRLSCARVLARTLKQIFSICSSAPTKLF